MDGVMDASMHTDAGNDQAPRCGHCGSARIAAAKVRSAFWHGERLVVVEDIPALVCADCQEQFYDDRTTVLLDLMRGDGFPAEAANAELRVPVFTFGGLRDKP